MESIAATAIGGEEVTDPVDDGCGAELSFFVDRDYVVEFIHIVCGESWEVEFTEKFDLITAALGKYQEQPTLLNPHLSEMLTPMTEKMITIATSVAADVSNSLILKALLPQFHAICKGVQLCCRIRGFKHVMKLFPHEVSHLELCLMLLRAQDSKDYENWETRYVLILWLCILCLIPFDICSMDSSLKTFTTTDYQPGSGDEKSSSLVLEIVDIARGYLSDPGPIRDAASACLSSLLTRPDMDNLLLSSFFNYACGVTTGWTSKGSSASSEVASNSFEVIGVLQTIAQIFKKGERGRLLSNAPRLLEQCVAITAQTNQVKIRKLTIKLIQRIGMTFLPPRVATWRYQRGKRSLCDNLNKSMTIPSGAQSADTLSKIADSVDSEEEDFQVEVELEDVLDKIISSLSDSDTVVRWSAAKGVGRISMRLPKSYANEVVGAVLGLFEDPESDSAWHGGCLALAELSRRGLLLPERLEEVMPIVTKAIQYDVLRGQHSVGSHVRDAACYVCWSFARAYSPSVMSPYVTALSCAMLVTALFDREINCRRAASAAFQEHVGRQGNENFPHGIEIITIADYFSLGNRINAYLVIAPSVAALDSQLHAALKDHLINIKLAHWDTEMRVIAARCLASLVNIHNHDQKNAQIPDSGPGSSQAVCALELLLPSCLASSLAKRHGAVLGVAEVLLTAVLNSSTGAVDMSDNMVLEITNLVPKIDKGRLYRGKGGEQFRQASCLLIENIAKCHLTMPVKTQLHLLDLVNENLKQPHSVLRESAASALRQLLFTYFSSSPQPPSDKLLAVTVSKYLTALKSGDNVALTRGSALALGVLPNRLANYCEGRLDEIFQTLGDACKPSRLIAGESDVETRKAAVEAVVELAERLPLTAKQMNTCFTILLGSCSDYKTDKRGDTGSWCRIAAVQGLERLMYVTFRTTPKNIPEAVPENILKDNHDVIPVENSSKIASAGHSFSDSPGQVVMTSYGIAKIVRNFDFENTETKMVEKEQNLDLGSQKKGIFVKFSTGSLGHFFALNSFQIHNLPPGVFAVHKSGLKPVPCVGVIPKVIAITESSPASSEINLNLNSDLNENNSDINDGTPKDFNTPIKDKKKENNSIITNDNNDNKADIDDKMTSEFDFKAMVPIVVSAMIKQLSEKLDQVRSIAGNSLQNILRSVDPLIPDIIDREILRREMKIMQQINHNQRNTQSKKSEKNENSEVGNIENSPTLTDIDWSMPELVFPFAVNGIMKNSNYYFETVFSGLVIAVGGMSEQIVRESSSALLKLCRGWTEENNTEGILKIANSLIKLYHQHKSDDRVIIPLLKTTEFLLKSGVFYGQYLRPTRSSFFNDMLIATSSEQKATSDVIKLRACIDLYLLLLQIEEPVRSSALRNMLLLLGHKFPRIRKYTAEALYLQLLSDSHALGSTYAETQSALQSRNLTDPGSTDGTDGDVVPLYTGFAATSEELDAISELIAGTAWDGEITIGRENRQRVCDMMGVKMNVKSSSDQASGKAKPTKVVADELDSYESLVRDAGY